MAASQVAWNIADAEGRLPAHLSVAIVDDNETMRGLVVEMLRSLGLNRFLTASDGAEAVLKIAPANPDLLIVDCYMQPLNGVEFTRLVRHGKTELEPAVPIIFMSGHGQADVVGAARDAGVSEFLVKPFATDILRARILTSLERPRPFIRARGYVGPDRRRRRLAWGGPERRHSVYWPAPEPDHVA